MTSASALFYNWRSRAGRNPEPELGLDPHPSDRDSDLNRHPILRRRSHDPSRRSPAGTPQARHHLCHRAFQTEREPVRLGNSGPQDSPTGNSSNGGTASSRVDRSTLVRNDRLPGSVLQARARLFERLRGISRTGNGQNITPSSIPWDEFAISDDFGVIDSGDWETETLREWLESSIQFDLAAEVSQASSLQDANKKPPGLTWEAIRSLPQTLFEGGESDTVTSASLECCICLERFWKGDRLTLLGCDHRFHPACLEPWVRNCGDCPYCRAGI